MAVTAPASSASPGIDIRPEPRAIAGEALRFWREPGETTLLGEDRRGWQDRTRAELGLAVDRPVVGTGHQAALWHPGIAIKPILAHAVAESIEGIAAHLVVDQDDNSFDVIDVPVRDADGVLTSTGWQWTRQRPDIPTGAQPAAPPAPIPTIAAALPGLDARLRETHALLDRFRREPSIAHQLGRAALAALESCGATGAQHLFTAGDMMRTTLAQRLLDAIEADPWRCAEAYNAAVRRVSGSAAPLLVRDDRVEIPLWRVEPDGRRLHAYDDDIARARASNDDHGRSQGRGPVLRPRALLNTALVRLSAVDLFIHGTGGVIYDQATELWIREWLGVELAPMAMATATLLLPFPELAQPEPDPAAAQVRYRRAWSDPFDAAPAPRDPLRGDDLRGDTCACIRSGPSAAKQALLDAIDREPRGSAARRRAFRTLHEALTVERSANADLLDRLRREVDMARRGLRSLATARRRDWSFLLHDPETIRSLRREVAVPGAVPHTG